MALSGQREEQCQLWYDGGGGGEMGFKSVVSLRAVWGCDTSVNGSKTHIVTCRTDEQSSAGGFWRRRVADVCL